MSVTAHFVAAMLGCHTSDAPPPEGSLLQGLRQLMRERDAGNLTEEEFEAALQRLRRTSPVDPDSGFEL